MLYSKLTRKYHTMNNRRAYLSACLAGVAIAALTLNLSSCVSIPRGAKAVNPFDRNKYLGTWYEIARMDFKFEKGLDHVTATYSLINEKTIRVDNKGYSTIEKKWKESIGKAKLAGDSSEGRLKVSFFGPFYGGYNVIAIDRDYQFALVAGNNLHYLWFLSREKIMPKEVKEKYLLQAQALGYDTSKLVWTNQKD
jgi:apolipoprotein D and lipocalin family protein